MEGLGARLRRLLEALDGEVEAVYREAGLPFRPRFAPVVRELEQASPLTLRSLEQRLGVSHAAISQTISEMKRLGLVEARHGADRREREVSLTKEAAAMLPKLHAVWDAAAAAATELDAELPHPLGALIDEALQALSAAPFGGRVRTRLSVPKGAVE